MKRLKHKMLKWLSDRLDTAVRLVFLAIITISVTATLFFALSQMIYCWTQS